MNTQLMLYNPSESIDRKFEYPIPENIPLYNKESSDSEDFIDSNVSPSQIDEYVDQSADIKIVPPALEPLKGKYTLLQLWEGRVVDIKNSEFDAIITNKTNTEFPDEFVTIELDEISQDDIELVTEGAVFYWSVGYLDYPGRGRTRESKIRFRRLKGWSKAEMNEANKIGKQFAEFFESNSIYTS